MASGCVARGAGPRRWARPGGGLATPGQLVERSVNGRPPVFSVLLLNRPQALLELTPTVAEVNAVDAAPGVARDACHWPAPQGVQHRPTLYQHCYTFITSAERGLRRFAPSPLAASTTSELPERDTQRTINSGMSFRLSRP